MLRAIRYPDIATTPICFTGVPLDDSMISAKKGGRIVKTEKVAKLKKKKLNSNQRIWKSEERIMPKAWRKKVS